MALTLEAFMEALMDFLMILEYMIECLVIKKLMLSIKNSLIVIQMSQIK